DGLQIIDGDGVRSWLADGEPHRLLHQRIGESDRIATVVRGGQLAVLADEAERAFAFVALRGVHADATVDTRARLASVIALAKESVAELPRRAAASVPTGNVLAFGTGCAGVEPWRHALVDVRTAFAVAGEAHVTH